MERCTDFSEHPGWSQKHPTGPVTWDASCSKCGFALEDRPWADGRAIEGSGRRLGYVHDVIIKDGEAFQSENRYIACSECVPALLGKVKG